MLRDKIGKATSEKRGLPVKVNKAWQSWEELQRLSSFIIASEIQVVPYIDTVSQKSPSADEDYVIRLRSKRNSY